MNETHTAVSLKIDTNKLPTSVMAPFRIQQSKYMIPNVLFFQS